MNSLMKPCPCCDDESARHEKHLNAMLAEQVANLRRQIVEMGKRAKCLSEEAGICVYDIIGDECGCDECSDTDDDTICRWCNGSGEGMYDGSSCKECKGSGAVRHEW